nr:hypothetical protein BaRGS_034545 [Batillaria attramentaria]
MVILGVELKPFLISNGSGEQELATRTLHIQSKRFYLDVKQNRRGRFIKVAEVGAGGKKSRLLLAMSSAAEFRDYLTDFTEHYASLGPTNTESPPEDGKLKSETIVKDNRRYYLDLKENQRGRFLRKHWVFMYSPLLQVRNNFRTAVTIPERSWARFRDVLSEFVDKSSLKDSE